MSRHFGLLAGGLLPGAAVVFGCSKSGGKECESPGGQQQANHEAVAGAPGGFAFLAASPLLGPAGAIAAVEGVLGLVTLWAAAGLIEDEKPGAVPTTLPLQEQVGDVLEQSPVLGPVRAVQGSCDPGAASSLRAGGWAAA